MKFLSAQLMRNRNTSKGFTLIELLVVIGILGILATALVATIDPFQQLKKANDANVKNTAVEFTDANIRYYTTHNELPWAATDTTYGTPCAGGVHSVATGTNAIPVGTANLGNLTNSCLDELISDGELKDAFTTAGNVLDSIYITGTTNSVTACFSPQSKAEQNDGNTKYKYDSTAKVFTSDGSCPNTSNPSACFWCAQ